MKRSGRTLARRHAWGKAVMALFLASTFLAVGSLATLIFSIVDQTAGFVLTEYENREEDVLPPDEAGGPRELSGLDRAELMGVLEENLRPRRLAALEAERPLAERPDLDLRDMIQAEVLKPEVLRTWNLVDSLLHKKTILETAAREHPKARVDFRFWLSLAFFTRSQSSNALSSGVRSAILGSFLTILVTIILAFPLGVGAAIWLEEYARDDGLNRFIRTNIYNLSGVPSIIYGMLGLGIFVRFLGPLTSGALFGVASDGGNGRTILSAGLTLALLILPIIIINAQEALRAVPRSLRESAYALGATRWQVIWHHVLPASMDRVLTGTVLALSRAVGETAPLVVVGASTFLTRDPTGIFSKFTTLPIQIYQWTARPQEEFRNIAAAAILVLMILLMTLNASAIIFRNKYRKEKRLGP